MKKRYTLFKSLREDYIFPEEDIDTFDDWQVENYFSCLEIGGAGLPGGVYMIYDHKEKKVIIVFKVRDAKVGR